MKKKRVDLVKWAPTDEKILEIMEKGFGYIHQDCRIRVTPFDRALFEAGVKEEARRVLALIALWDYDSQHIRAQMILRDIKEAVEKGDLPE